MIRVLYLRARGVSTAAARLQYSFFIEVYRNFCDIVIDIYKKFGISRNTIAISFWISWNTIAISFRILRNTIARGRQGRQRAYIVGIDIVLYYCLKCSNELRMKPFSNVRKFLRFDKITFYCCYSGLL